MSKVKSIAVVAARVVLGLIYFVFGLNFFLNFLSMPQPTLSASAQAYVTGLFQSGFFFPMLKGIEVVLGALLLVGALVPLSLVILMPISLNILLYHTILAPEGAPMGIVIFAVHLFLAWAYRDAYKPLFKVKTAASL
ncbi:MAG TPA: hypothetical protein VIN08_28315 [Ohtaekwangia sp.]|uniref:hypothetical protein n=1 Tax=Ohtaekwangia sp. TaxID=2066019 RepID=UPI002F938BAC